ncbi:TIGR02281 family clan AA aspartic protease [Phenylobacterium sp.]|uniref:retropepsin-like aspartic protease family protein n=1 Tax=Phenylobacterium sp. TaxID=1871053 RepID=UPI00374CE2BE
MSNFRTFSLVMAVACASALISAQTVVMLATKAPVFRAARAEAAISAANAEAAQGGPRATIPKSADGHYWAEVEADGGPVRLLVDTGATAVALTPRDAARLGVDLGALRYSNRVVTATGQARAASVKLASLTVSGARIENVDALVIEHGLDTSLLGMTYLGRLASFQATRQALILQP